MDDEEAVNRRLADWTAMLSAALGVGREVIDIAQVLAVAGEAAHAVVRPAAPLTTFIVGYAAGLSAGRGKPAAEALAVAISTARRHCADVAAQ